jgi:hypothetical protein
MESSVGARTASLPSQAPTPHRPDPYPSPAPLPSGVLHAFEDAVEKAGRVCALARGREVVGIVECVRKLISAERLRAVHILAAADLALRELG